MNQISADVWSAAHTLELKWQEAAERWRDATAGEFEEQHWLPLAERTAAYIKVTRELDAVIASIRNLTATE